MLNEDCGVEEDWVSIREAYLKTSKKVLGRRNITIQNLCLAEGPGGGLRKGRK